MPGEKECYAKDLSTIVWGGKEVPRKIFEEALSELCFYHLGSLGMELSDFEKKYIESHKEETK